MILIAYDGSADARSAIEHAGSLMPGQPAIVLSIWEPYSRVLARSPAPFGIVAGVDDIASIDEAADETAVEQAEQGAALARSHGLDATPRTRAREDSVAEAILTEADRVNASAIVMGTRGLGSLGSLVMGSVSHAVLQHADRAVIVVPSPTVARQRQDKRRARAGVAD
ncbi:MAG: universal stress protein [Solirubrobacteraceae bacterium]